VVADEQVVDLETSEGRDSREIWRRSRCVQIAADARLRPGKRDSFEETEGQKILRGDAGVARFRSGVKTRVRKRYGMEGIYKELRKIESPNYPS